MKELSFNEVKYNMDFTTMKDREDNNYIPEYKQVYREIKRALEIDKEGYNVYLIDDFSKEKLENIMKFINDNIQSTPPKDICYVVNEDTKSPKAIFTSNGKGKVFHEYVERIQGLYLQKTYDFYNNSDNKEKEKLLEIVQKNRSELVNKMVKVAEDSGFDIKFTQAGFTFIPIKDDGNAMSEKEYDSLEKQKKDSIIDKVATLKEEAQDILDQMKDKEEEGITSIKELMKIYYNDVMKEIKNTYRKEFLKDEVIANFLNDMCVQIEKNLLDNYSMDYEDDEEMINEIIYKYCVNVIVDNSNNKKPVCIYEDDPSLSNLLGNIEYENKNGVYTTDVSLINAGSMLKANDGCIIIRVNNLLSNSLAYYYLKKTLINGKVDIDYNRGYLELLSLSGLHPEPININEKVILIGDYETYNILYSYDEDFKKIFKIRAEVNSVLKVNDEIKATFVKNIRSICKSSNFKPIKDDGILEIAKFISRKAENRNKMYFNLDEVDRIITLANNKVKNENKEYIEGKDIIDIAYNEEEIENEILEAFEENKIFINLNGKLVGEINGLTVLDTGYYSFGKPVRITCNCYKGEGNIIDVQKDSELSGKIHSKAINILKGYINTLIGGYNKLPVDFHVSFEQVYGKIDGDSASVAEIIVMISALSKIGINSSIAVTGSINQLGEVQPIGGVNEKIEGFFKVCKKLDTVSGKGVLIPDSNKDNLVLSKEVEEEIGKGNFHIYTMETIEDAVNILMGDGRDIYNEVLETMEKELKKYNNKKDLK
ncbi:AAA family ATPase [Clostridium lundense]|uniref:AAA family ATPase n=1 Tax=Clostridium lundense TaxID=319475 RepID=UPI0004823625|nr:AAA family ATPase [Clostridium lundense]